MKSFMRRFKERFFLRFHMSLILTATILSGLLATKLLLFLQVNNIVVRYPLAVLCSYLAFFLFVKLWLAYISASHSFKGPDILGNVVPDPSDLSGGGSGPNVKLPAFRGGGGSFGGAGASGAFDGPAANVRAAFVPPPADAATSSSGVSDAVGEAASGIFGFDDDSMVLIAIGVLLAAIFGAAIYLIYIAPHILSEAAFNFLLGSSLIRSYRKMNNPDWMGSVFKDTYIPFVIVLLISLGAALVIHKYAPGITRISDFFRI